jgi:hypothetical protein
MSEIAPHEAAIWYGKDLATDPSWRYPLSPAQIDDLHRAMDAVAQRRLPLAAIDRTAFALPNWQPLIVEARRQVEVGRGFALLRGIPVDRYSVSDLELLFWGIGTHLGIGVTQTAASEFIAHVTDKGPVSGLRRGFQTNREAKFHIDLADAVGLLCIRQAKSGGQSLLASSATAFALLRREQPDLLPILTRGFAWDRREEHGPGEEPVGPVVPVFASYDGHFRCTYNRNFLETVYKRRGTTMTAAEIEALDTLDRIIDREELHLSMDFQPGDIQLVSNETVLHARSAYEDFEAQDRRRHLLRLWWDFDGASARAGAIGPLPYGNLGRVVGETAPV